MLMVLMNRNSVYIYSPSLWLMIDEEEEDDGYAIYVTVDK